MTSPSTDRRFGLASNVAMKAPVTCATTANITLNGLQTIDGVLVVQDNRVLVKNQTNGVDNGIYLADSGNWTRDADFDGSYDILQGSCVHVVNGTSNSNSWWEIITTNPVIGTSSLSFSRSLPSDAGSMGYLPAGAGAVATTVQAKLRGTVKTPKDFGAIGDGVADDGPALQLWANALSATPSMRGKLESYTYLTNQTITVNPNTTNGVIPPIFGNGAQNSIIKAGPSLGASPILKHQGASPSANIQWSGFKLLGTGAANGQYGIHHINTCFVNYDNLMFDGLQEWVRFENAGAGFTEQNVLTNCWGANCKYALGYRRQAGSSTDSFRGTGLGANCHMDLTTVAGARLIRVYNDTALPPNLYNIPLNATVWADVNSIITQNDGTTPIRAAGILRYESSAAFVLGSGSAADTFRGILDGVSFNPTLGTYRLLSNYSVDVNPAFSASASTPQSVTSGVATKVTLGTSEYDSNSNFASSKFTATIAGYYEFNATIRFNAVSNITQANIVLYKNGAASDALIECPFAAADNVTNVTLSGSVVTHLAVGDYVELYGLLVGVTPVFDSATGAARSRLSGSLVRQDNL